MILTEMDREGGDIKSRNTTIFGDVPNQPGTGRKTNDLMVETKDGERVDAITLSHQAIVEYERLLKSEGVLPQ